MLLQSWKVKLKPRDILGCRKIEGRRQRDNLFPGRFPPESASDTRHHKITFFCGSQFGRRDIELNRTELFRIEATFTGDVLGALGRSNRGKYVFGEVGLIDTP
jgi:hypothetical protein